MLYAVVAASAIAFAPPASLRSHVYMSTKTAPAAPTMALSARRAHLGALASGLAGLVASNQVANAAEVRSTPWAMSTFLDAIDSDLIEKVSFSADGKQALAIVSARALSRAPPRAPAFSHASRSVLLSDARPRGRAVPRPLVAPLFCPPLTAPVACVAFRTRTATGTRPSSFLASRRS